MCSSCLLCFNQHTDTKRLFSKSAYAVFEYFVVVCESLMRI